MSESGGTRDAVSIGLLVQAQAGNEDAFRQLVAPYQRMLQLHCYRLLGSAHDAEDAMQETLLAVWQGLSAFEGRSSLRTWLFRIATTRCMNALRSRRRRPPKETAMHELDLPEPTGSGDIPWLEPYPDALIEGLADSSPGPEARYATKEAISLAFVTALQLLPPRQRAVLILRDVLGFHSREVAQMLDSSEHSVNSALKRARVTLHLRVPPGEGESPRSPTSRAERDLVERFTRAFESGDIACIVGLLTDNARVSMPPMPFEWRGLDRVGQVLTALMLSHGLERRLIPTRANGQPAFGLYLGNPHASLLQVAGLLVLTVAGTRVAAITRFDSSVLPLFGLPRTVPS